MEEIIRVENVRKTFALSRKEQKLEKTKNKLKVAVDGLSFVINKGEIYGLLGPNGAGKTTTLRIMSTLIKPDSGDVFIEGNSVVTKQDAVRNKICFLTSELKLEDFFTPNYLFDFFSNLYGVDEATREERKQKLFKKFEIDKFAEVQVRDLSTGMKQKVSLVVSLVHDPDIIIFDEPTNGLDVVTAKKVTDYLLDLKQEGKTIIISTHIFSLVEKLCDRVGIIVKGKMILSDSVNKLTKEKSLEDVFFDIYSREVGEE